jgi:hypothetical protein
VSNFRPTDRQTGFLMPPSVDEWLPPRHLACFVVEVIDGLDLKSMSKTYRGSGSAPYHPAMLLGLLVYGCATGVFSSRKLERATYDSVRPSRTWGCYGRPCRGAGGQDEVAGRDGGDRRRSRSWPIWSGSRAP